MGTGIYYTRQNTGYPLNKHEYDAWGYNTKAPTYNYDPDYRATEPYFTGHPYDGALNLYYAHNRFYDAQTGQWLSEDPIKSGLNWYQYCGSNPVSYVDLLGLEEEGEEGTAKAYIFYQPGMYGSTLLSGGSYWDKETEKEYVHLLKQDVMEYYGYINPDDIEIIPVKSKEEFIDKWNNYLPDKVEMIGVNLHGSPNGIQFVEYQKVVVDGQEIMQNMSTNEDVLTTEEILSELDYKDVSVMLSLNCNSLGFREGEITENTVERDINQENPPAFAFQSIGVQSQLGSKGFVQLEKVDERLRYSSVAILEDTTIISQMFYRVQKFFNTETPIPVTEEFGYFYKVTGSGIDYSYEDFYTDYMGENEYEYSVSTILNALKAGQED